MKNKFIKSNTLWRKAKKLIPMGTQTFSKAPNQYAEGLTPKYIEKGKGCYVWDIDGNKFLDFLVGLGPIVLGYSDDDVNKAAVEQLNKGILFGIPNKVEVEVSERLIDLIPCAESVRFGKNGADVTSAAIRISRAITKKDHIAYCGYHGWHDWYIANTDLNSGIPKFNQKLSHSFNYNDLDSLEKIFKKYPDSISCVMMEPVSIIEPKGSFLNEVKKMAHHYNALLVFDEVWSGFRWANGGAQEFFKVVPDLACFAKAMSNGFPVSAITGKKNYLSALEKTFFSFTYGGECLSLVAAKTTMDKIISKDVVNHIWQVGLYLKDNINQLHIDYNLNDFLNCIGYPCRSILSFKDHPKLFDNFELKTFFQQELAKRNIIWSGFNGLNYCHNIKDLDIFLDAYDQTLRSLKKTINKNKKLSEKIEVPIVKPVFSRVSDFISEMNKNK